MDGELLTTPNVIWTGDAQAPTAVNVGNERIELPDDAAQRKGFAHERGHMLIALGMGWETYIGKGGE